MKTNEEMAQKLMIDFAKNTGLRGEHEQRRYLWTDAFAVCNFIQLYNDTQDKEFETLAIDLVESVHNTLGKYREDDERSGWLASEDHPTKNGLRIGKALPERPKGKPINQQKEWERDGQYFHYLTRWMEALVHLGNHLEKEIYFRWAQELAEASTKFVHGKGMYWKMSTDLDRPLIPSMGQHDPLDGHTTYKIIDLFSKKSLKQPLNKMEKMTSKMRYLTRDPLGLGGMLISAYKLWQMSFGKTQKNEGNTKKKKKNNERKNKKDKEIIEKIIKAAKPGLSHLHSNVHGLAFRELGLAIGLYSADKMNKLSDFLHIRKDLNIYWREHQSWSEHKDINQVMLCTSLKPDEYVSIPPRD